MVRTGSFRQMVDGQWRRVKGYHAIISLEKNDHAENADQLKRARHEAIRIAKDHGFVWGLMAIHPYRGPKGSTGSERRDNLDREIQKLHFHIVGLAHWIKPSAPDQDYVFKIPTKKDPEGEGFSGVLGTVGKTSSSIRSLWGRIMSVLRYELDHAGRLDHSQFIVRFGKRTPVTRRDLRPVPKTTYEIKDPDHDIFTGSELAGYEADAYVVAWISKCLSFYSKSKPPPDGKRFLNQYLLYEYPSQYCSKILDDEYGIEWDLDLIERVERQNPFR